MSEKSKGSPLPRPTVKYVLNPSDIDESATQGIVSNPVYTGIPPYPRVIPDATWIRAAVELINEEGAEQFLVNMLYMLRASMISVVPDEAIPDDYDGPWPDDEDIEDAALFLEDDDRLPSWHHPIEGFIYCSHDGLPMIILDDELICVAEYLNAHIDNAPVTDLITKPTLTLVFQNGHTLPLICPDCGESLHIADHTELLDDINGLTIINTDWDDDLDELILEFGHPGDDTEELDTVPYLEVHLNSVRELTCPHRNIWDDDLLEEYDSP